MTDRITQAEFRQMRSSASGTSLREIAEAAQSKASGENVQPAPSNARKRYVVGIDPGVKTGFAVWDRDAERFDSIETSNFWSVFFRVTKSFVFNPANTLIVIEVAHYAPVFRERKAKGQNENHAARLAQNVGQVMREAKLLAEGLRRLGYEVIEQKPLGKAKNAADDRAQFERLTGWTERTSQHARDAARICFQR